MGQLGIGSHSGDAVRVNGDAASADSSDPHICNSNQGFHFTNPQYTQRLLATDVQATMDGKGHAIDNVFTERLWRTIKYEKVYMHDYTSPEEAYQQLRKFLHFYNHRYLHQSLSYQTPAAVYFRKVDQRIVAQQ
jgi:putative transposase